MIYDPKPPHTQVPNYILDEMLPLLSETELKVLLIVIRQTLGWIEDEETGRRKEKDWISISQFGKKTGCGRVAVGRAITKLVKSGLVEAYNAKGDLLETPEMRQKAGMRIFYRLKTRVPSLFDKGKTTCSQSEQGGVLTFEAAHKVSTTKETDLTKEYSVRSEALFSWNTQLFNGFKEVGVKIVNIPAERMKFPRNMRRKNPDVGFWLKVAKFSQEFGFRQKNGEYVFPWRGAIKLSKLYYEAYGKFMEGRAAHEGLKRLAEMKTGTFRRMERATEEVTV